MEAFGAQLEVLPSPEGITPELIPRMRARAAELAIELDGYQTDQFTQPRHGRRLPTGSAPRSSSSCPIRIDAFCVVRRHRGLLPRREPDVARPRHRDASRRRRARRSPRCCRAVRRERIASRVAARGSCPTSSPPTTSTRRSRSRPTTRSRWLAARPVKRACSPDPSTGANVTAALELARRLGRRQQSRDDPGRLWSQVPRGTGLPRRLTHTLRPSTAASRSAADAPGGATCSSSNIPGPRWRVAYSRANGIRVSASSGSRSVL